MDAHDDPAATIAFLLKHELRLYPRSRIAGSNDDRARSDADKLVDGLRRRGYRFVKGPGKPLHSADCGRPQ